jgi:hypothetical protein
VKERAKLLREAAQKVGEAARSLNVGKVVCQHCTRTSYESWTEAVAAKELGAVVEKLERWAKRLEGEVEAA